MKHFRELLKDPEYPRNLQFCEAQQFPTNLKSVYNVDAALLYSDASNAVSTTLCFLSRDA